MRITVNGDRRDVPDDLSVADLLDHLGLDERAIVVEHNREILRRPRYAEVRLRDGDELELVHFVGGGGGPS